MHQDIFLLNTLTQKSIAEQMLFAVGLVLLFFGQRTYRFALFLPSFLLGISLMHSYFIQYSTVVRLGLVLGIGVLGVGLVMAVEQFTIALVGAFLGGGCMHYLGWDFFVCLDAMLNPRDFIPDIHEPTSVPWYYTSLSAFLGAFLFSTFFERYLSITTSFCASILLCWILECRNIDEYHIFLLIWLVGCFFQYLYQPSQKSKYPERS
jgi:hypothetical protein